MFENASNELLTSPHIPPKIEPLLWKNPIATSRPKQNSKSEVQQRLHVGVKREKKWSKEKGQKVTEYHRHKTFVKHNIRGSTT